MYVTRAILTARYGQDRLVQLTDRDGTAGAIVDAVLDQAIADAAAEIDAHLAGRYQLPLATVPPVVEGIAARLALLALHVDSAPELVTESAATARQSLRAIARGDLKLPVAGVDPAETPGILAASSAPVMPAAVADFLAGGGA